MRRFDGARMRPTDPELFRQLLLRDPGMLSIIGDITIADVVRVNQFVLGRIKSFEE